MILSLVHTFCNTGLDPARPYFENWTSENNRLAKTDADFVDVIHTNAGDLIEGCLAIPWQLGHVDFYPNGGDHMAGCHDWKPSRFHLLNVFNAMKALVKACSHMRAPLYYSDSIRNFKDPNYFLARKCSNFDDFEKNKCSNAEHLPMGEQLAKEM